MTQKELRIGSFVNYFDDGEYSIISTLDWGYVHLKDASSIEYRFIKSIPLTEEWLVKFGFKYKKKYDAFVKTINKCNEFIIAKNVGKKENYYLCDIDIETELKNVHQLQNLYFALTNEELIIK